MNSSRAVHVVSNSSNTTLHSERSALLERYHTKSRSAENSSISSDTLSSPISQDEESRPADGGENARDGDSPKSPVSATNAGAIISVLLLGIFVAHADESILLATHPVIASEFGQLDNSSWLIISFALAGASTQSLVRLGCTVLAYRLRKLPEANYECFQYGKLSDIYGRKAPILISTTIFAIGV